MPNALVFHVPMELGLEFMAAISADRLDAKGEFLDELISESNGIFLIVPRVDLECPYPCRIVDGRVLKTPDTLSIWGLKV
jgi:hypothetical protein